MKPNIDTEILRAALEKALGEEILHMTLVQECSRPENFSVLTRSSAHYAVKCCEVTPNSLSRLEALEAHLRELESVGARAIRLVRPPLSVQEKYRVFITNWCAGGRVMPNKLSAMQRRKLPEALLQFSDQPQHVTHALPARNLLELRQDVAEKLGPARFKGIFKCVAPWFGDEFFTYRSNELKVIHGDLHHGNFYWLEDDLSGVLDLEEFRYGYTTDDWIRYITCAVEHTLWCDFTARDRILSVFRTLVPHFPAHQWHTAINGALIRKAAMRLAKTRNRLWYCMNMKYRVDFYRRLHKIVETLHSSQDR